MQQQRVIIVELIKEMIVYCYPLCGCRTMVERVTQQKTRTVQQSPYSSKPPPLHTPHCTSTRTHRQPSFSDYLFSQHKNLSRSLHGNRRKTSFFSSHLFIGNVRQRTHTQNQTIQQSSLVALYVCVFRIQYTQFTVCAHTDNIQRGYVLY